MNIRPVNSRSITAPRFCCAFFALTLSLLFGVAVNAQVDDADDAPPPVKLIPKDEKAQLVAESNLKDRVKISLTLMDAHLAAAERLSTAGDAAGTFKELGNFHALMDESLDVLQHNDPNSGKVLDAFKKLEIGLRAFMGRLESVRRGLPLECDEYVRDLMHDLREARAKAVDPLFSDNVVKTPGGQ